MNLRFIMVFLALAACSVHGVLGQSSIGDTRTALEKWVEARKQTAALKAEWSQEKETLEAAIGLFESQLEGLKKKIEDVKTGEKGNEEIANQIKEQEARTQELDQVDAKLKELLAKLETKLKSVVKSFPAPLANRLKDFTAKIPEDSSDTKATNGQRMQLIAAILKEVDTFNSKITVESETRDNQGLLVPVTTIYLGMAQAYFSDARGNFAGVGKPGPDGWVWTTDNSLGPEISKAVKIYEKKAPVGYANLPITIQ